MGPANIVRQQAKSTKGSWQTPERSKDLTTAKILKKKKTKPMLQHLWKDAEYSKAP